MSVLRVFQQDLGGVLGYDRSLRACLPACLYMLARAHGYMRDIDFETFGSRLDWSDAYEVGRGWIRPRLTKQLRDQYGVAIVSWRLNAPSEPAIDRMRAAGYLNTPREVDWFVDHVSKWPLEVLIAAGTPVITTMQPGFGANQSAHSVILAALIDDTYEVIDPDERNDRTHYSIREITELMSPTGAATVILPRIA